MIHFSLPSAAGTSMSQNGVLVILSPKRAGNRSLPTSTLPTPVFLEESPLVLKSKLYWFSLCCPTLLQQRPASSAMPCILSSPFSKPQLILQMQMTSFASFSWFATVPANSWSLTRAHSTFTTPPFKLVTLFFNLPCGHASMLLPMSCYMQQISLVYP